MNESDKINYNQWFIQKMDQLFVVMRRDGKMKILLTYIKNKMDYYA